MTDRQLLVLIMVLALLLALGLIMRKGDKNDVR